jgi:hypothetical protein
LRDSKSKQRCLQNLRFPHLESFEIKCGCEIL